MIGVIIARENAKYLLSGYNTMSADDRKKISIILQKNSIQ